MIYQLPKLYKRKYDIFDLQRDRRDRAKLTGDYSTKARRLTAGKEGVHHSLLLGEEKGGT